MATKRQPKQTLESPFYTLQEVAGLLRISWKTAWRRAKAGAFHGCIGGRHTPYRINKAKFNKQHKAD